MTERRRNVEVDRFGDYEVRRVVEWVGPIGAVENVLPDTPGGYWSANQDWLAPAFFEPSTTAYRAAIQTWVVHGRGHTIVVDTGVGNDRERPQVPTFDHLSTDFLHRLDQAGVDRDEVDLVVNTHIHYDHVGWNTALVDGRWAPTFPNARYLVPARDRDYFRPENASAMRAPRTADEKARFDGIRLVYADSITPIEQSGQLQTWDGEWHIDDVLHLEPAPGHTPGSSVLWLDSGDGAVFVGDLTHSPVQIVRPDDACSFDLDAAAARESRRRVFAEAARRGTTVLPAHYAGPGGASIAETTDDGYRIREWAEFAEA